MKLYGEYTLVLDEHDGNSHSDYNLTDYYCQECGFEFSSTDAEHCPACQSQDILKAH
jgi:predicted Zn-ribbon and HTH transcriptional regulator